MNREVERNLTTALKITARTTTVGLLLLGASHFTDTTNVRAEGIPSEYTLQLTSDIQAAREHILKSLQKIAARGRFRFARQPQQAVSVADETGVCIGRYQIGDGYYGLIQNSVTSTTTMCKVD